MDNSRSLSAWERILAMPNDSPTKIVTVALVVCLICSILVSSAAVLLKPIQKQNKALGRKKEILKVAGLYEPGSDIEAAFRALQTRYIDLETGQYADNSLVAEQSPVSIPAEQDSAGIGKRLRYIPVYLAQTDGKLDTLILPLVGKGLWSTIHGFVALSADGNTIKAITFYDQAETPGLGGEITNPVWQAKWQGKKIVSLNGRMQLRVIKGHVDPSSADAAYEVDGLSGATLTSNGITGMVRYWLGDYGFGPFLTHLRASANGGMTHE